MSETDAPINVLIVREIDRQSKTTIIIFTCKTDLKKTLVDKLKLMIQGITSELKQNTIDGKLTPKERIFLRIETQKIE